MSRSTPRITVASGRWHVLVPIGRAGKRSSRPSSSQSDESDVGSHGRSNIDLCRAAMKVTTLTSPSTASPARRRKKGHGIWRPRASKLAINLPSDCGVAVRASAGESSKQQQQTPGTGEERPRRDGIFRSMFFSGGALIMTHQVSTQIMNTVPLEN